MSAPKIEGEPKISQQGPGVICEALVVSGDPPAVKWTRDDKEINNGDEFILKIEPEGGKYKISCLITCFDKPYAGIYKAAITNKAGTTNSTFTVTAGDAPEFTEKPHIVTRNEGKVLGIKIRAKSKHDASVSWTKDDKPIKYDDRVKNVIKSEDKKTGEYVFVLEINMPQKEDEGKYICTVKNSEGQNSQSLNLNFD